MEASLIYNDVLIAIDTFFNVLIVAVIDMESMRQRAMSSRGLPERSYIPSPVFQVDEHSINPAPRVSGNCTRSFDQASDYVRNIKLHPGALTEEAALEEEVKFNSHSNYFFILLSALTRIVSTP